MGAPTEGAVRAVTGGALQGRRILVTRPAAQSAALVGMIRSQGGEAVCFPLLEIGPVDDLAPLAAAAATLDACDFVVFISPNAVDYGVPGLLAGRAWPSSVRAAAIGPGTVLALSAHGIGPVLVPSERFDSEALLDLPELRPEHVDGRRVLILRGNGGRELLAETLRARGATVDCVSCYRRSAPSDVSALAAWLREDRLDALTISSSEGLRHLWHLLEAPEREALRRLPLFVPHARIAGEAAGLGLERIVQTAPADAGIIDALVAFTGFSHA